MKLEIYIQKNHVGSLPHTRYKNELKMGDRPKCKRQNFKNPGLSLCVLGLGHGFLFDTESIKEKRKNKLDSVLPQN